MLYLFLVDLGNMIQLDMNMALESVKVLKESVARSCCIPVDKQVLLISGGQSLEDEEPVYKYSAGTDNNPIFLFSLASIESSFPPEIGCDLGNDADLVEKVEASLRFRDAPSTVAIRASLAQEFVRASTEHLKICETLIHDQHLQHQGWAAVVANLEDTATDLHRLLDKFGGAFREYLAKRDHYKQLVESFDDDMAMLHRIPVFSALLKLEHSESMIGSVIPNRPFEGECMSLLEWISSRGSTQPLEQVADGCYRAIQKMDKELWDELQSRCSLAVSASNNAQMKEIRGLGDRLSALEQLLIDGKRVLQEQTDLAKAFLQNQQRVSGLNDTSILPDLCASHRQQLIVMMQNHKEILSIRSRCSKAKGELAANLHHRMKWVGFVNNQMADIGELLVLHSQELKRIERRLQVMEQLHTAPSMYLASAVEVVRRRNFSRRFLNKASSVADQFSSCTSEEINLRSSFQTKLRKHFLAKMFPGMDDVPPEFASARPAPFDHHLPDISLNDVEKLRRMFPDLAKSLSLPDVDALTNLLERSFNQTLTQEDGETLNSLQAIPQKIHINSAHIGSVSVMNKLISEPAYRCKKLPSSRMQMVSDSETDTDDADRCHRRRSRKRSDDKLTRSLPLDSSLMLTAASGLADDGCCIESTGFAVEAPEKSSVEPSLSSTAPSSSHTGNDSSSVAPSSSSDGSMMKQQHHHQPLQSLIKPPEDLWASLLPAKETVAQLRAEVLQQKADFVELRLAANIFFQQLMRHDQARALLVQKADADLALTKEQLQLETHKSNDITRELDRYRQQLELTTLEVDKLKTELNLERERFMDEKEKLQQVHEAEVKRLTLEHELELDAIRQQTEHSDKLLMLDQLKDELEALRRQTRLLDQKFNEEKERVVEILEAGRQREKMAVQQCAEEAEQRHDQEKASMLAKFKRDLTEATTQAEERLILQHQSAMDTVKRQMEEQLEQLHRHQDELVAAAVEAERKQSAEKLEAALKAQHEKLQVRLKREMEGMRKRYKMLHTAGALVDRSPSSSDSDSVLLSLEQSPRQDLIEGVRSALLAEFEQTLSAERSAWQSRLDEQKARYDQALEQAKIKGTAAQQVLFNEALKKAMEEKDRQLEELSQQCLAQLKDNLPGDNHTLNGARRAEPPDTLTRHKALSCSVVSLRNDDVMMKSGIGAATVPPSGHISCSSIERGDVVLVVWDPKHGQYTVFTHCSPTLHFVHADSLDALGLSANPDPQPALVMAEVVDKQFCQVKKSENRFNVPKGTTFYRVLCRPFSVGI